MAQTPSPQTVTQHRTRRLAIALLGVLVCSLLGLDVWQSWTARNQALANARNNALNLARSLAEHASSSVEQADTVLTDLVERVQTDGAEGAQHERLHRIMQAATAAHDQIHGLFIYGPDGSWRVTSNDVDPPGANNADRDYFRYHQAHTGNGPQLGKVITSRSDGALIIPLSRRINGPNGEFAGVALATLEVKYFNDFYKSFDLDRLGVISLTLDDGTLLARRPFEPKLVNTSVAKSRIFTTLLPESSSGAQMFPSIVDGVTRMYGYDKVQAYPLVLIAGQSEQAVLAAWYANLWRTAGFVGLLLVVTLLFGALLLRQLRQTSQTEAELRNAHAALEKLAMQDGLTGLGNRRQLELALPHEIGRARRSQRPLGVIMLDIDHFKRYNDRYGHPEGDVCIRSVGQAVLGCVNRSGDLVVRYGGEELLVLLPESDLAGTRWIAQQIVDAVRALAIPHLDNEPVPVVTVSAGVYVWQSSEAERPQALVEAADSALYEAKRAGRNRIAIHAASTVTPQQSASSTAPQA